MIPRARMPPPQHQGTTSNYPPTLGFNNYFQPNYPRQQGTWNQGQNYNVNNRLKRDRLRSRNQGFSFYSDDSLNTINSNYLNNRIVNAALRNLPPNSRGNHAYRGDHSNRGSRGGSSNDGDKGRSSRGSERGNNHGVFNREESSKERRHGRRQKSEGESPFKMYFCPKCGENYAYRHSQNKYIGKIPLILRCNHTVCQECIYQNLTNNKISCPTCQTDSILTHDETPVCQTDLQNIFPPNYYIIGVIAYHRPLGGSLSTLDNIGFVSTALKKQAELPSISERCCFGSCSKEATMFCPSCEGIYCGDCCTVVHKSTKKLMSHEPISRSKHTFSLMLENCAEHDKMVAEFFCNTCDLTACCYCVLDQHTDHERVALYSLTEPEMEEFKRLKKEAEKTLREVLTTQKKAAQLSNFNTNSVRKDVCQYFVDFHAKIYCVERRLCDELEGFKSKNRGLDSVQTSLTASAEQLKQLVTFNVDKIEDKKLNLRGALEILRSIKSIPRFLLNDSGSSEPVRFVVNAAAISAVDKDFVIEKCEESEYRLVTEEDLPENYVFDALTSTDSDIESTMSALMLSKSEDMRIQTSSSNEMPKLISASASVSSIKSKRLQKHTKPIQQNQKKLDMDRVDVQHVNSMDSFYVQYRNTQSKLNQLNKEIENYVKMGGAQNVPQPQINNLYLALYIEDTQHLNQKEQHWFRARLLEIKNGENGPLYEMFFIDYGKTQTVDGNRIRDIPPFLVQKKPFSIECMLHNPMSLSWKKRAHYYLAKIVAGKEVLMIIRSINAGVYEVDLMIASSDGGVTSVTDILVHATNSVENQSNDDIASIDEAFILRKEIYYPQVRVFPNSKRFTKNQKEKVVIANIVDPYNVFVHMLAHQEAFKSMGHAIKKAYKNAKDSGCIPIEGTYVLVEYRDTIRSNWHRAFIKSVDLNSDKVHVLLVDWGFNVVVSSCQIKPLQESFTKLESQAVLVKLAHIAPYNKQPTWSRHAASFLQAYHVSQDILKMVVHEVEPEVQVALFDISAQVDVCLNALMVDSNLADSTGPISTQREWPQYNLETPKFSEEEGLMASMLKKVDEEADDSGDEDTSGGRKRQVDVIKVVGPDLLWVKFLEFRDRESKMFKELQIHYSQEQVTQDSWKEGDYCVVELRQEFARGKILEKLKEGLEYKVFLYDKVEEVTTTPEKLFVYNKYFMCYSQAAVRSHLANIRPAGDTGKWSISSIEALQEIFSKHRRIYASKVEESNTDLEKKSLPLDVWYGVIIQGGPLDPDQMKYVSINNFLVKLGFAYKMPKPSMSIMSPVKTVKNGEDLLRVLVNNEEEKKMVEEKDIVVESEEKNETKKTEEKKEKKGKRKYKSVKKEKDSQIVPREKSLSGSSGVENPKKEDTSKRKEEKEEAKKTCAKDSEEEEAKVSSQDDKSEEPTTDKSDDKKKAKPSKDPIETNWNAIVEQELGESVASKTLLKMSASTKGLEISHDEENAAKKGGEGENGSPYHKSEVVIDDWLPPFRLTNRDFQARVTCVETGGRLYIHDQAMDGVYYKMEANIKEYFDNNPPEKSEHEWEPGHLCTIKYNDGNWYRGRILKVKNCQEISVLMIDFGSDHDLPPDVLFREVLYTDIGAFATKVKLDKVYSKASSWLSSDYDNLHDLVSDWCRIIVKGPLDVEMPLVDVYDENGVYVNQRLVELCPNLSRCSNFPIDLAVEEDESVVIESEEPYLEKMCLENFSRASDIDITPEVEIDMKHLRYKQLTIPETLLDQKKVLLEIGGILNYDKVAIKEPGENPSEDLYDLIIDIQDAADLLPVLKDIQVGTPCIAPYSDDGIWYRATVSGTNTLELGFVDIFFVDYGNSESVAVGNVKVTKPEWLRLPQQTWEAFLNVTLIQEADTNAVMQIIKSLDRKKRFVKMVKEDPLTVDLYDKSGNLCYQTLIDSGSVAPLSNENR